MATGLDFLNKYLQNKGTTDNADNADNGTGYRSAVEADPLQDTADLMKKVDADAEANREQSPVVEQPATDSAEASGKAQSNGFVATAADRSGAFSNPSERDEAKDITTFANKVNTDAETYKQPVTVTPTDKPITHIPMTIGKESGAADAETDKALHDIYPELEKAGLEIADEDSLKNLAKTPGGVEYINGLIDDAATRKKASPQPQGGFDKSKYDHKLIYHFNDNNGELTSIEDVYTNDGGKTVYNDKGEQVTYSENGDKKAFPKLSQEEELSKRVATVYDRFEQAMAMNGADKDTEKAKNTLWSMMQGKRPFDLSRYKEGAEESLKDAAWNLYLQQRLNKNAEERIKKEAYDKKNTAENLRKASAESHPDAKYVKPGTVEFGTLYTNVNQPAVDAARYYNTKTKWLIEAGEGEEKRVKGFVSGLKGLGLGMAHGIRNSAASVFGIIDVVHISQVLGASRRYAQGKNTKDDDIVLDAYLNYREAQQVYNKKKGYCYGIGEGFAQTIPYILEFIFNPLASAGKAVIQGMTRKLIAKYGTEWVRANLGTLANRQVRAIVERELRNKLARVVGSKLAKPAAYAVDLAGYGLGSTISAGAMSLTTGLPQIYVDKVERQLNDGDSNAEAWRKSVLSAMNERGSEFAGPLFGKFFGLLGKGAKKVANGLVGKERLLAIGKALGKTAPVAVTRELITDISNSGGGKMMRDFAKKAHWDGFFEEDGEEIFGSFMDALVIGDQHFLDENGKPDFKGENSFFNVRERIDEAVNVGFTTLMLGMPAVVSYRTPKYRMSQAVKTYDALCSDAFGENWQAFKSTIDACKPEQISSVIVGCMQAGANAKQVNALTKYAVYKARLDAAVELEQGNRFDENSDQDEVATEEAYDNGYTLEGQQRNDAKNRLEDAEKTAAGVLNLENESDVQSAIGLNDDNSNAVEVVKDINQREDLNDDTKQKVTEYVNARVAMQGTIDAAKDDIDTQIEISDKRIDNQADEEGMVRTAQLKNGTAVYIRNGNVTTDDKGEVITSESDNTLVVQDQVTGELQMVPASDVLQVTSVASADQLKTEAANAIRMETAQKHAREIDGTLPFNVGDVYDMEDKDGKPLQVEVVADLGNGNVSVNWNGTNVSVPASQIQTLNDNYNRKRLAVWKASREQTDGSGKATEEQSPLAQIPVDENGVRQYTQAAPVTSYDALVEATGTAEGALQVIEAEREKARKALDKVMRATPQGTTTDEIVESARQLSIAKQEADAVYRYWDTVGRVPAYKEQKQRYEAAQASFKRKKDISKAVSEAVAVSQMQEQSAEAARFNELASQIETLEGEEKKKVLDEMSQLIATFAKENGYDPVVAPTFEEFLGIDALAPQLRNIETVVSAGEKVVGFYYRGKIYLNVEHMTPNKSMSAFDVMASTLVHESVHEDNDTQEGKELLSITADAIRGGQIAIQEALDIIEAVSGSRNYARQAAEMAKRGKDPTEMIADELMAHMVQAMSWGVPVESLTSNETLTNIINSAYEYRERVRSGRADVSQRSEVVHAASEGIGRPGTGTDGERESGEHGRGDTVAGTEKEGEVKTEEVPSDDSEETAEEHPAEGSDATVEQEKSEPRPVGKGTKKNGAKQEKSEKNVDEPRFSFTNEEQEIIDRAKADGTYMQAPNGKPTNLNVRQWVQVRTKAFKKWFGDWEKAIKWKAINAMNATPIENRSVSEGDAQKAYDNIGVVKNAIDGKNVDFVKSSFGKIVRHKGVDTKMIMDKLDVLFRESLPLFFEKEVAKEGHKDHSSNFVGYHHYLNKITIDGKEYYIRFTAQEIKTNPSRKKGDGFTPYQFHNTSISDIAIYESTDSSVESPGTFPVTGTNRAHFDAKLANFLKDAKESYENSSKVVDENGEPRVVYHGTPLSRSQITPNRGWHGDDYVSQEAPFHTFRGGEYSGMIFTSVDYDKAMAIAEKRAESIPDDAEGNEQWTTEGYVFDLYVDAKKPFNAKTDAEAILKTFGDKIPTLSFYGGKGELVDMETARQMLAGNNSWLVTETPEFVEKIMEQGYDALIGTDEGVGYVACFAPNQLKSATDNIGTFDANNDDIRFSTRKDGTKRISPQKEWENAYVNSWSRLFNRDKKEVRADLTKMLADAKHEAKELYENVLAGDFNSVTLQQINDYIDNATNKNRFYRPLSQRLPERALLALQGYGRTNAVDALFSRICESTVAKNGRVSAEGRRKIEAKKEELLEGWAKATGNWHESIADFTENTTPFKSGTDSDVYLSNDGKTVIKASKGKFDNKKYPSDIDQVALFNYIFPHSAYRILGYGKLNGHFVKFLEQNFVDFSTSTPLTTEERVEYMHRLGFVPRNEEKTVFSNRYMLVSDLQKANVVRDIDGNIRVLDADVKLHTKDIGGSYTYKDVEADTDASYLDTNVVDKPMFSIRNDNERRAAENAYNFAQKLRPGEDWRYAVVNMERPGAVPLYEQKRSRARSECKYFNELHWGNYKLLDLDKTFDENAETLPGKFPEEYKVKYSFIGEKGAENADHAEEVTTRLDNLAVAREMEEAKKDAKTIKMATGWERGADGKWRYEIPDGKIVENPNVESHVEDESGETWYTATLGDIYDAPEVYRAYPQLKTMQVVIQQLPIGTIGGYGNGMLSLNSHFFIQEELREYEQRELAKIESSPEFKAFSEKMEEAREKHNVEELRSVINDFENTDLGKRRRQLLNVPKRVVERFGNEASSVVAHEIQHAIQGIEGFAQGGNTKLPALKETPEYKAWEEQVARLREESSEEKELNETIAEYSKEYNELFDRIEAFENSTAATGEESADSLNRQKEVLNELEGEINELVDKLEEVGHKRGEKVQAALDSVEGVLWNLYNRLAGEVESRNVEVRSKMTEEERRASLASETEDVAREDQIFLFGEGGESRSEEELSKVDNMKRKVAELFEKAQTGEFIGKPQSIGRLSTDGKAYLERLSGLKFKKFVDFVLNPSDLNHIRADHYGENEKDKGSNVPLTDGDIRNIVDVLNQPDGILYGIDKKDGRKLFFFLKNAGNGLYNLTEVCSTKKGNLTAKSFFKSRKKGIDQRVVEIKDSLLPTSVTYSGEFLSSDAKIPTMFDIRESSGENLQGEGRFSITRATDGTYTVDGEKGLRPIYKTTEKLPEKLNDGKYLTNYNRYADIVRNMGLNTAARWQRNNPARLLYRDIFETPSLEDYYADTRAEFEGVDLKGRSADEVWNEMKDSGKYDWHKSPKSDSEYLVDTKTGEIYRKADHWGRVASCAWKLDGYDNVADADGYAIAHANIKGFKPIRNERNTVDNPHTDEFMHEIRQSIVNYTDALENIPMTDKARSWMTEARDRMTDLLDWVKKNNSTNRQVRLSVVNANAKFNEELDEFTLENADNFVFDLGRPSGKLIAAGVADMPIRLYGSKLAKKIRSHGFSAKELKNLPLAMENPIAVFDNLERKGNRSVLTELKTADGNFLVTIDLGKGLDADFDIVSSVFGKKGNSVVNWINNGLLKYVDKEKALNYLRLSAPIAEASDKSELNSATKVIQDFDNPKVEDGNIDDTPKFSITSATDFANDISEKGLGGVLGKEAVERFADNLYINNADIRREINKGIAEAGFDYKKATRNWFGKIAGGDVTPKQWHDIRTAFQKMLRDNGINAQLSDGDVAYALWKETNPGNDIFTQAKDISKQMDLGAGRFSVVAPNAGMALDEYNRRALSKKLDWQEAWQDAMISVKALQDSVAMETGTPISDSEDAYHAENRMYGAGKNEAEFYMDNYLEPLLNEVDDVLQEAKRKRVNLDYNGLNDYLMAKHGIERNSFFALKSMLDEAQQERAEKVTAKLKAKAEQDYQDALNAARQLTDPIDMMNAVKKANSAKRKADVQAERTGIEEGRKLRDRLYDGYVNDPDLAQLKYEYSRGDIDFREFETLKRGIMEKHLPGVTQRIVEQGDKAGLSNVMNDDTDYENLAFDFVTGLESTLEMRGLWEKINAATGATLKKSYESGKMTKKAYDYVSGMFDFYVPLRGWDETTADEVYEYENASRPVFTPSVKKMFGRKSKAENPIAYIGNMAVSDISSGNKNLMKQYLLRLAQNHPTSAMSVSEVWYENIGTPTNAQWVEVAPNIKEGMSGADITAEMERFNNDMEQKRQQGLAKRQREHLSVGMPILPMQEQEHRVDVMVDGKKYSIFINGSPKAAQAVNGTNKAEVNFHLGDRTLQKVNRFISEVLTSKNPAFIPANFTRDMLGAHSQIWIKENAAYIMGFEKNVAKVLLTPRKGGAVGITGYMPELLRKWKKGTLDESNETERYFKEFMTNGGETGYVNILGVEEFKNDIAKRLNNFHGHAGRNAWHAVWDTVEFYNRAVEDTTRFITYMTSRQQGRSVDRSIDDCKTISLNFNRKGSGKKGNALLRKLVIFVNPAIQALDNQFKLISSHPARFAGMIAFLIMRGMVQSKLNELLISLFGDDDDKDAYYSIPEWTRRNNFVMWIPGTHNWFKIPLSQEFRLWHGLGETMQGVIDGRTKSNPALELTTSMLALLPVDPTGNGGNPIANIMPTSLKPLYEITENENFLGLPIYADNDYNRYEPEFQRVTYGTPSWMTKTSEGLNSLTGGDTHEKGWLEETLQDNKYARMLTNPGVWNHLLSGYMGGPYNLISQSVGVGTDLADGNGVKVGNVPIVSRFVARPMERENAGKLSDHYRDLLDEAEETRSHFRAYRKDYERAALNGDGEAMQEAREKMNRIMRSEDFIRSRIIEAYDGHVRKIRQLIRKTDDEETKARYNKILKRLEEQLCERLEPEPEEAEIKK